VRTASSGALESSSSAFGMLRRGGGDGGGAGRLKGSMPNMQSLGAAEAAAPEDDDGGDGSGSSNSCYAWSDPLQLRMLASVAATWPAAAAAAADVGAAVVTVAAAVDPRVAAPFRCLVGRCKLPVSNPELKVRLVSALKAKM
jgi:hypothetical protein